MEDRQAAVQWLAIVACRRRKSLHNQIDAGRREARELAVTKVCFVDDLGEQLHAA